MRGGPPAQVRQVLAQARAVAIREAPPAPVQAELGLERELTRRNVLGRRLAGLLNGWADSKDDPELDEAIAEARRIGWLT